MEKIKNLFKDPKTTVVSILFFLAAGANGVGIIDDQTLKFIQTMLGGLGFLIAADSKK